MKTVLITGACGGMGRAAVALFREEGYRIFALDNKEIEESEGVVPVVADVTDEQSLGAAFEKVREHTDSLSAVIHFAGVYMLDSLVEMEREDFDKIFAVNLRGPYLVNKMFLPMLKEKSRILMVTSELAPLAPLPFTGIYAVSKCALDRYAYSLCMELQLLGIKVSVLRAGAVKTDMLGASTDALEQFCNKTELYSCNAERFRKIVESVEARNVSPERVAKKCCAIVEKRSPSFAYSINRNPLLLLLNALPKRVQLFVIKSILK